MLPFPTPTAPTPLTAPMTSSMTGPVVFPMMGFLLVLVLQLTPGDGSGNGAEEAVAARPVAGEMSGQSAGDGTTQATFALGSVRVVWFVGVLWRVALLLVLRGVGVLVGGLLWWVLTVLRLLLRIWVIAPLVLWRRWAAAGSQSVCGPKSPRRRLLTSSPTVLADCLNRRSHTVLRPVRAGSLHVAEGHRSLLCGEAHSPRECHRTGELVVGSLAAAHILATGRRVDSLAEGRSSSEDIDCMGPT